MGFPTSTTVARTTSGPRFVFEKGNGLGDTLLRWLEINAANCAGQDKESFPDRRVEWVNECRTLIEAVAADPFNTAEVWREMDEPFRFVSSCRELVAAWLNTENFVTHLPIPFDGSCNGIQHLALLSLDEEAGARVNLINSKEPRDVYKEVALLVQDLIEKDETPDAADWRAALGKMDARQKKKPGNLSSGPR